MVTGRVTDAALVIGPAAWRHGWDYDAARHGDQRTLDALAGALVAGHVIECGAQATGGNYAFFRDVPGLEHPGLPIAEVAADGSAVITKHDGTGGMVTLGTVTAQLLYEIGGPEYANPDVTARFETIRLAQDGRDRVRISGTVGMAPPERLKVAMNYLGGFRNSLTLVLTGLDIEAKADLALRTVAGVTLEQARSLDARALGAVSSLDVGELAVELQPRAVIDPALPVEAQSFLRLTVKDPDADRVGKAFTAPVIEATLSSYPGMFPTTPPGRGEPVRRLLAHHGGAGPTWQPACRSTARRCRRWRHDVAAAPARHLRRGPQRRQGRRTPTSALWVVDPVEAAAVALAHGGDAALVPADDAVDLADARYAWLVSVLTVDGVRTLLPETRRPAGRGPPLPNLRAVNVVVHGLLGRGVAETTRVDPQAKGLGEHLRARLVDIPVDLLDGPGA